MQGIFARFATPRVLVRSTGAHTIRHTGRCRCSSTTAASETGGGPWAAYLRALERRPLLTKAVTSGFLTFTADVICQLAAPSKAVQEKLNSAEAEGKGKGKGSSSMAKLQLQLRALDVVRTGIFTFLGVVYIAPALHVWYGFLMRSIQGVTARATLTRVFFDQSVFAPTFLAGLFSGGLLLEGKPDHIRDKLVNDLPPTVLMNWSIWIPSMLVMFRFCPAHLQVLFSNSIGFFWNIYLTWRLNKDDDEEEEGTVDAAEAATKA